MIVSMPESEGGRGTNRLRYTDGLGLLNRIPLSYGWKLLRHHHFGNHIHFGNGSLRAGLVDPTNRLPSGVGLIRPNVEGLVDRHKEESCVRDLLGGDLLLRPPTAGPGGRSVAPHVTR